MPVLWGNIKDERLLFTKAFLNSVWEGSLQKNTALANLGNHPVSCSYGFVHALSCMNNMHARTQTHTHGEKGMNHHVCRVETSIFYKHHARWKGCLKYADHPWGRLLNSLQAEARGAQEESRGIATNGEDPPNQEIILQRFRVTLFFFFFKEGRPIQLL